MSCYLIKSKLNGLVLDIKGGSKDAGAKVITYTNNGTDNQLWYDDPATDTIRSKLHGFCLDLNNDILVVKPYAAGAQTQQWDKSDQFIRSKNNRNNVLDIYGAKKSTSAKVGLYDLHGESNQQWEYVMVPTAPAPNAPFPAGPSVPSQTPEPPTPSQPHQPPTPGGSLYPTDTLRDIGKPEQGGQSAAARREFYIVSAFNQKVVDIQGKSMAADAKLILWDNEKSPLIRNQLWYKDEEGHIRSCLNNYVFQNEENGNLLRMTPYRKKPEGQWTIDDNKNLIINKAGDCLEVKGRHKEENGVELYSGKYKGETTQQWMLQYI